MRAPLIPEIGIIMTKDNIALRAAHFALGGSIGIRREFESPCCTCIRIIGMLKTKHTIRIEHPVMGKIARRYLLQPRFEILIVEKQVRIGSARCHRTRVELDCKLCGVG